MLQKMRFLEGQQPRHAPHAAFFLNTLHHVAAIKKNLNTLPLLF